MAAAMRLGQEPKRRAALSDAAREHGLDVKFVANLLNIHRLTSVVKSDAVWNNLQTRQPGQLLLTFSATPSEM